ncbi:hypothetical protein N1851_022323 [Merluccius polli]|uniref:Uncharacterized protein n=1 Tax=Merluccius polli TaxID=89951 RepID=A0AA47MIC3_MERPO|nr:hypothetical protein N1851_022323 [Merluccius polli]
MYKAKNKQLPGNIQRLFTEREGGYNLRGELNMKQHYARTNIKSMCISICGVVLWNGLEEKIKQSINVIEFKKMYKKYIFTRHEHITPILASLHWLPIHFRIHFKILLFAFKSLNGLAPPYLSELLHPYTPTRCLRSADQLLLRQPKTKLKLRGDRAFAVAAPNLWNDLPQHIRQASSLSVFKSLVKTHLFSLAFDT